MRFTTILAIVVVSLWQLPKVWYKSDGAVGRLVLRNSIPGWSFEEIPIGESAEAILLADEVVSGEFKRGNGVCIRVFSAKRTRKRQNEIGLFVHTPDRCWTSAGWKLESTDPLTVERVIDGIPVRFERRIFVQRGRRELVYFAGFTGARPLAHRLDHNLSMGIKTGLARGERRVALGRIIDNRFWSRTWEAFLTRRALGDHQQFLRISTPIIDGTTEDRVLTEFIRDWITILGQGTDADESTANHENRRV